MKLNLHLSLAIGSFFVFPSITALAQQPQPKAWSQEKCDRYAKVYSEALAKMQLPGVSVEFIEMHDAFMASGCIARAQVCPRSQDELRLVNVLIIMGMNAGMASTFFPFACRQITAPKDMPPDPRHSP